MICRFCRHDIEVGPDSFEPSSIHGPQLHSTWKSYGLPNIVLLGYRRSEPNVGFQ
jgi:hypothetical protein